MICISADIERNEDRRPSNRVAERWQQSRH